jgi:hypothetical protein
MPHRYRYELVALTLFAMTSYAQVFSSMSINTSGGNTTATFGAPSPRGLAVVSGSPYSADEFTERVQTLADGTRITQNRFIKHVVRDSKGRMRTERLLLTTAIIGPGDEATGPRYIEIDDPVAGFAYVLDEVNKVAHRAEILRQGEQPAAVPKKREESGDASKAAGPRPDVGPPEKLGFQTIEGVLAEGTRRITTWPLGSQGNDRPIRITNETWFSPDLQMIVLSKTLNPLTGDTLLTLRNISRTEPDPSVLQSPRGFTIVDEKGSFQMTLKWQ